MKNQLRDAITAIKAKSSTEGADRVRNMAFESDGCTHVPDWNIRYCCESHDRDYMNPMTSRWQDDCKLLRCMRNKMPWYSPIPMVYFLGVRAVGASRHAAFQEYTYEDIGDELWG